MGTRALVGFALADAARSCGRAVGKGRSRDRSRVDSEYNQGSWKDELSLRRWEKSSDLQQFLVGESQQEAVRNLNGRARWLNQQQYNDWRVRVVQGVVDATAPGTDELVELGCGYGANLFSLWLAGRWSRLLGLDISPNAISVGRAVAERFHADGVAFDQIDLTNAADPGWGRLRGMTVLTYFCLEQLPSRLGEVLESLLAAQPRRVINVESALGMLSPTRPLDWLNRLYVRSMGYQSDLVHRIDEMESVGRIRLLTRQRLRFGPTIHNDPCLLVWEPTQLGAGQPLRSVTSSA